MAKLYIETHEQYAINIDDELYQRYLNGELDADDIFMKVGDEIWDCNQFAEVDKVYIK